MNYTLKQATLNKLAQTRLAVNYVIRARLMEKLAAEEDKRRRDPDWARNLELSDQTNGAVGIGTPQWVRGMGGKLDKARTMEHYETPESSPRSYFWPFGGGVKEQQKRVKATQGKRDPKKVKEYEKYKGAH